MKTSRIKSEKYKGQKIQFGPFVMTFSKQGIAEVDVKDDNVQASLDSIVKAFGADICYLEDSENAALEAQKEKNIEFYKKLVESKDEEIAVLRISNETLSTELIQVKAELKAYKQMKGTTGVQAASPVDTDKGKGTDTTSKGNEGGEIEGDKQISEEFTKTYDELNKKTVAELKDILVEVFGEFESEWKSLTKKDDIITYIIGKSEASEKE